MLSGDEVYGDDVTSGVAEPDIIDARCPACGDWIDYCQGHGDIGDPLGADILKLHDLDQHQDCHPSGCEQAPR